MDASINIDDLPIEAYRCMKSCDPCLRKKVNMSADDFCITCNKYYCWVHKKVSSSCCMLILALFNSDVLVNILLVFLFYWAYVVV